jgi:thymidylate synthase (FAD)
MKIVLESVELLWCTPEPEKQIEIAGRTCYKSEDKITEDSAKEFCTRMVKSGHHAMIEQAVASLRIVTDRGISHEIVRHRLASYAQESTRYCNYSKKKFGNELTFIQPHNLSETERRTWKLSCDAAELSYFTFIAKGAPPQIARSVLPNSLKTEIVMTANFREWRHFIKLRAGKVAHPQIRVIAEVVYNTLRPLATSIFTPDLLPEKTILVRI